MGCDLARGKIKSLINGQIVQKHYLVARLMGFMVYV
jgi:hypothetical protein